VPPPRALPGSEQLPLDDDVKSELPQWLTLLGYAGALLAEKARIGRWARSGLHGCTPLPGCDGLVSRCASNGAAGGCILLGPQLRAARCRPPSLRSFHLSASHIYTALSWYTVLWAAINLLDRETRGQYDTVGTVVGELSSTAWRAHASCRSSHAQRAVRAAASRRAAPAVQAPPSWASTP
jgi:hypothetical protein